MRTFGIRRNEKIAVHATVRGKKAEEILDKGLAVHEYELKDRNFSTSGTPCSLAANEKKILFHFSRVRRQLWLRC